MNNIIETKDLITFGEDFPKLAIGNNLYPVNDLKETADKIDAVLKDDKIQNKDNEVLKLALGEKALEEIMSMKIKTSGYVTLVQLVMATIQGMSLEEFKKQSEKN